MHTIHWSRTALTLIFILLAVGRAAVAAPFLLYVSNEISGDVTVFDGEKLLSQGSFPVGKRPRGIEVTPDGKFILVAVSGSPRMGPGADRERAEAPAADKAADGIVLVDAVSRKVLKKLEVGSDPEEFAVSPDGERVFVANEDTAEFSCWEISSGNKLWSVGVGQEPEGVSLSPDARRVAVGCEESGELFFVDTKSGEKLGRTVVGKRPRSIAFSPNGALAYVALEGDGGVAVVDGLNFRLIEKIAVPAQPALPMGIVVTADGKSAYVTLGRSGKVAQIDLGTRKAVGFAEVGKRPWGAVLSPDGKLVFTANGPSNDISVVATSSLKEIKKLPAGQGPWGIAIGPKL